MVLSFLWLGSCTVAPRLWARRALKRGTAALERREFPSARHYFRDAARYEPFREEALCLLAETDLLDRKPSHALKVLNSYLAHDRHRAGPRSARFRLLRGLAGCLLGRVGAARRELAAIPKSEASVDELLAAAQACVLCQDAAGAHQLLDKIECDSAIAGGLAGRVRICRAALYFRLGAWEKCLDALPDDEICSPPDAAICRHIRELVMQKIAEGETAGKHEAVGDPLGESAAGLMLAS
jgi:hypothetical protein